jgi:LysR family nitrogen assimilation transcriptional regulator
MNSDDLELFSRVAKAGSVSRAALQLGANQSSVSRRIAALEAELDVRLFRRSGRGVGLTERGELLLHYATTMERTLKEAERVLRESSDSGPTRLCIAAQPTIVRIMFGSLGHALKARYPKARVRFVEGLASHILTWLNDGEVDIAVMYVPEHRGALQYDLLLSEGVCLITPANYPLQGDTIDVSSLGGIPLILPSTPHGLRVLVESLAARHGFTPDIALECDGSISITKRLVLENCGCTVLPSAAVVEKVAAGRLKSFRLGNPAVRRDIAITLPHNRTTPDGLWEVANLIRQRSGDLVRQGAWPDAKILASHSAAPQDPLADD